MTAMTISDTERREVAAKMREGGSDAPLAGDKGQTATDAHADGNEAADGARTPSIEVISWVNEHGGLDEVKRRVWASNELNDKLRSRERKIERLKKALSYADAKNAERRAGAKFIRENGGLEEVRRYCECGRNIESWNEQKADLYELMHECGGVDGIRKRLMPEGMEWPRFETGEQVKFGDEVHAENEPPYPSFDIVIDRIALDHSGFFTLFDDGNCEVEYRIGERVNRPAPKVLDADGAEIRVGDTVWWTRNYTGTFRVESITLSGKCVIKDDDPDEPCGMTVPPDQLTHRAPILAADGEPLEVGQTVWDTNGDELVVGALEDGGHTVTCRYVDVGDAIPVHGMWSPSDLTHQRPVLDADGAPIREGDTVWDVETGCKRTVRSVNDNETVEFDGHENRGWFGKFLTHRAPVLAADGKPIREGETVYVLGFGEPLTVKGFTDDGRVLMSFHDENSLGYKPSRITHEQPDTWERIEEDAVKDCWEYWGCEMHLCTEGCPNEVDGKPPYKRLGVDDCCDAQTLDLVRRAKALAERGQ